MHHGMLSATGVLIDWAPGVNELAINRAELVLWR